MLKALIAVGVAPLLLMTACSESAPKFGPEAAGGSASAAPATDEDVSEKPQPEAEGDLALKGDWEELGPNGFLELRLGMTQEEALETGRISIGETANDCTGFYLAMYGDGSRLGAHGYFSTGQGLSLIHGQDEMHTPEGIALGSPVAQLHRAYPSLSGAEGLMTVTASDHANYFFVSRDESVSRFGLALADTPCLAEALG